MRVARCFFLRLKRRCAHSFYSTGNSAKVTIFGFTGATLPVFPFFKQLAANRSLGQYERVRPPVFSESAAADDNWRQTLEVLFSVLGMKKAV